MPKGPALHRRAIVAATPALAAAAATATSSAPARAQASPGPRRPIVLVHGAGHGGWCWRDVRRQLQAEGFEVFTPTMTGLGERVHLRSAQISLRTHITDIVNVIEFEELTDVVLVGHSYAGTIVTAVCDAVKPRIAHVVIIDGAVPKDGEATFPGITMAEMDKRYGGLIDGYLIPKLNVANLGFPDPTSEPAKWLNRRLTEHLAQVWAEPVSLPNGGTDGVPRTYVQCADPKAMSPAGQAKIASVKNDPSWTYIEKLGPHNLMMSDPAWTADLIRARALKA